MYMQRHGEVESRILYIDSRDRDNMHDDDNDFSITFDEPMRNVVGVKVIDSSIPASMYTVDDHNNTFLMFAFGVDTTDEMYDTSYSDFYALCFLESMTEQKWLNAKDDADALLVVRDYRAMPLSGLADMPAPTQYVQNGLPYAITVLGPYDVAPKEAVVKVMADSQHRKHMVAFHMDDGSGIPRKVFKRVFTFPNGFYTRLAPFISMSETGTGVRTAFLANGDIPFVQGTSTPADRLSTLEIMAKPWATALAVDSITGRALVAFDTMSTIAPVMGLQRPINEIRCMGGRVFSTNMIAGQSAPGDFIRTGDVVDLSGERYITLRCPQIESAAYIGTGKRSQGGIALFKLGNPGMIRRETSDYVNVVNKRFHPIAKMDRMDLRFERGATGELFNFRGTNPLIVLAVDVYVNKPNQDAFESTLNPEYDVDFRAYLVNRMQQDAILEAEAQDAAPMTQDRMDRARNEHAVMFDRY
jgi:hypothetical protein